MGVMVSGWPKDDAAPCAGAGCSEYESFGVPVHRRDPVMRDALQPGVRDEPENRARRQALMESLPGRIHVGEDDPTLRDVAARGWGTRIWSAARAVAVRLFVPHCVGCRKPMDCSCELMCESCRKVH